MLPIILWLADKLAGRAYSIHAWGSSRSYMVKKKLIRSIKASPDGNPAVNCYSRVKSETEELQKAVAQQQGLAPPDKEVAIVYRGERQAIDDLQAQVSAGRIPRRRQGEVGPMYIGWVG